MRLIVLIFVWLAAALTVGLLPFGQSPDVLDTTLLGLVVIVVARATENPLIAATGEAPRFWQ